LVLPDRLLVGDRPSHLWRRLWLVASHPLKAFFPAGPESAAALDMAGAPD
jgi:hypothetical protein